jgi:hypothetical protein
MKDLMIFEDIYKIKLKITIEYLSLHVYRSNDVSSQRIGLWTKTKWKNLQVFIKDQEWIPTDLLLLHFKGEEGLKLQH